MNPYLRITGTGPFTVTDLSGKPRTYRTLQGAKGAARWFADTEPRAVAAIETASHARMVQDERRYHAERDGTNTSRALAHGIGDKGIALPESEADIGEFTCDFKEI